MTLRLAAMTSTPGDRDRLAAVLAVPDRLLVICLCAAWCDTCEAFATSFERLAAADPAAACLWLDIEDDSGLVGDIEIENFPTLAVFRGGRVLFYGVTLPQEGVVARTVAALSAAATETPAPAAVASLPSRLARRGRD